MIQLADDLVQVAHRNHSVESLSLAHCRADADHLHAERLAARRQGLGDHANPEDADRLAVDDARQPALPDMLVLITNALRNAARERDHRSDRGLRHLRAMGASHVRHQRIGGQCRAVNDVVHASASALNPAQARHVAQDVIRAGR